MSLSRKKKKQVKLPVHLLSLLLILIIGVVVWICNPPKTRNLYRGDRLIVTHGFYTGCTLTLINKLPEGYQIGDNVCDIPSYAVSVTLDTRKMASDEDVVKFCGDK